MEIWGVDKYKTQSETSEKVAKESAEKEQARAERQQELHSEYLKEVEELKKISKVSQIEFDEIIKKYGTNDYARCLITKTPYTGTKTGSGLW